MEPIDLKGTPLKLKTSTGVITLHYQEITAPEGAKHPVHLTFGLSFEDYGQLYLQLLEKKKAAKNGR